MQKLKEKDIRDFEKYANKLKEVAERIESDGGCIMVDVDTIYLVCKDGKSVSEVSCHNLFAGYGGM